MFRSNGGIRLAPEICLLILEHAVDDDPKRVRELMLVSKSCSSLLYKYKKSIIVHALRHNVADLRYINSDGQTPILFTARMLFGECIGRAGTYSWLNEMRTRIQNMDFLISHRITEMSDPNEQWPTLACPKRELELRLTMFKKEGLHLLYRLADCAAGLKSKSSIRVRQATFLENQLRAEELACLAVMVEVMGQAFSSITQQALEASGVGTSSSSFDFFQLSTNFYRPLSLSDQDLSSPNWIREMACVFEDLLQCYGPAFAIAYLSDPTNSSRAGTRLPKLWARFKLQEGLDDLEVYEGGLTMAYASLQSVVWRKFCRKMECASEDSWEVAKQTVERRMAEYKV